MLELVTETMKMFIRMIDIGKSTDGAKAAFLDWCEHNDFPVVAGKEPGDMMPCYMLKSILEVALVEMVDRWEYVFEWSESLGYEISHLGGWPYDLRIHPHAILIAMMIREHNKVLQGCRLDMGSDKVSAASCHVYGYSTTAEPVSGRSKAIYFMVNELDDARVGSALVFLNRYMEKFKPST